MKASSTKLNLREYILTSTIFLISGIAIYNIESFQRKLISISLISYPNVQFNLIQLYDLGIICFLFGMSLVYLFIYFLNTKNGTSFWAMLFCLLISLEFAFNLIWNLFAIKQFQSLAHFGVMLCSISTLMYFRASIKIKFDNRIKYEIILVVLCSLFYLLVQSKRLETLYLIAQILYFGSNLILLVEIILTFFQAYKIKYISISIMILLLSINILSIIMVFPYKYYASKPVEIPSIRLVANVLIPFYYLVICSYFFAKDFSNMLNRQEEVKILTDEKNVILEKQNETLAQQVAEKTAELEAINNAKDKLFSIIAHDLRSPIASLINSLQLLDNQYLTKEEFLDLSKYLKNNVENVHGMLENLLQWSLSQMKGIKPTLKQFDLNLILNETIVFFEDVANQKQIDLKTNTNPSLFVYADQNQIQTVLRNLVNNAIKFTHQFGYVAISGDIRDNFAVLKISDSGIGIKQEDLPTIFSVPKLKRGTAGEKGTGLGLILCKDLIEQNGGKIIVVSEYEKGTTFEILLPIV